MPGEDTLFANQKPKKKFCVKYLSLMVSAGRSIIWRRKTNAQTHLKKTPSLLHPLPTISCNPLYPCAKISKFHVLSFVCHATRPPMARWARWWLAGWLMSRHELKAFFFVFPLPPHSCWWSPLSLFHVSSHIVIIFVVGVVCIWFVALLCCCCVSDVCCAK